MQTDWSVACGEDDPVVVVPWHDMTRDGNDGTSDAGNGPTTSLQYIDIRKNPTAIDQISEATQYPVLAAALTRWNQPDAFLFTSRCDVWNITSEDFGAEDLPGFTYAQVSYVDLISNDSALFSSFSACEQQLRVWTAEALRIVAPAGRCEWTLRPAQISTGIYTVAEGLAWEFGFATTLYVWGYGVSSEAAAIAWSSALEALIGPVLRSMAS